METTPEGRFPYSYLVISHPLHEGDPAHDPEIFSNIDRLEDEFFEAVPTDEGGLPSGYSK